MSYLKGNLTDVRMCVRGNFFNHMDHKIHGDIMCDKMYVDPECQRYTEEYTQRRGGVTVCDLKEDSETWLKHMTCTQICVMNKHMHTCTCFLVVKTYL